MDKAVLATKLTVTEDELAAASSEDPGITAIRMWIRASGAHFEIVGTPHGAYADGAGGILLGHVRSADGEDVVLTMSDPTSISHEIAARWPLADELAQFTSEYL